MVVKDLGSEGKLMAEIVNGKIKLSAAYDGKQMDATASVSSDSDLLVDLLCDLIPGDSATERAGAALLKAALKRLTV